MRHLGPTVAAVLAISLVACGKSESTAPDQPVAEAPKLSDAEKATILASYPAPFATADLANGEAKFALCKSCHTLVPGGANLTGPNLHGAFGRKAAAHDAYKFSDALKAANITWNATTLDPWLEKPMEMVPGTKMSFAGLKDAKDRTDVIAYMMVEGGYRP
jgi:cytochrome c